MDRTAALAHFSGIHREEAPPTPHTGPIETNGHGRTDNVDMAVPSGSFVIPADVVSGLGQGNTAAGYIVLRKLFGTHETEGHVHEHVPIVAAGGEYVMSPEQVMKVGKGSLRAGHSTLDAFVRHSRKLNIKTLKKLPGPARK